MCARRTKEPLTVRPGYSWLAVSMWAVCAMGAVVPAAQAQGSIPTLRGVYQGTGTASNCLASGQAEVTLTITNQVNDNFSGQAAGAAGATVFLSGTVDGSGHLQGTYEYDEPQAGGGDFSGNGTFMGQFDGSATPKTLDLVFTGMITLTGPVSVQCGETLTFQGSLLTATGGPAADLSISGSATPATAATGKTITYNLTVANAGPNDATDTLAVNPSAPGTSIVSAISSQGQCTVTPGSASCALGTIPNGGTAAITVIANVFAPAGSTLTDTPSVSSPVFDPNFSNNSTTITTPVNGGGVVKLSWNQQQSTGSDPTPAPTGLQAQPGPLGPSSGSASRGGANSVSALPAAPMDSCTQNGVNVYKSDQPGVQPLAANLFTKLAAGSVQAIVPVSPSGSSYVGTSLWQCGTAIVESGTSNEVDIPAGPTITGAKLTGKLKILGSGFNGQVQVFVDGVGFVKPAVVADSTLLIQKGVLNDGTAIGDLGTVKPILITVRNGDGGFASFVFQRP